MMSDKIVRLRLSGKLRALLDAGKDYVPSIYAALGEPSQLPVPNADASLTRN